MTTRTFTPEDIDRLATKLEALGDQLDEDDRATLHAVFTWAGRAVAADAPDEEVSGYAFDGSLPVSLGQSFAQGAASHSGTMEIFSFSFGAANPTTIGSSSTGGGGGKADLSDFSINK